MGDQKIYMDSMSFIRRRFPSTIVSRLSSEFAQLPSRSVEVKQVQEIQVYDPRKILSMGGFFESPDDYPMDKIQIRRIVKAVPVEKLDDSLYNLVYVSIIEVIKEYTFEEWDSVLQH